MITLIVSLSVNAESTGHASPAGFSSACATPSIKSRARADQGVPCWSPASKSGNAVEHLEQQLLLEARERQRGPWPRPRRAPRADGAVPGSIAVHEPTIQPERLAGRCHPDMRRKIIHRAHHAFSLVSSAVGNLSATHSFFLGLDDQFRPLLAGT